MDRLIYTAMSGANHTLNQQATVSHNLANATTHGYRAQLNAFRAVPIVAADGSGAGTSLATRAFVVDATAGSDFTPGAIQQTGRDLDVAIEGQGFIAVQLEDGSEAYTRNGSLQISVNGQLQTRSGVNVLGDGGTIAIPPDGRVSIARDGTVAIAKEGQKAISAAGRIKLVNPSESQMVRGDDGLFRLRDGSEAEVDNKVALLSGALEGSNVNLVEEMVNMIALARQFETQMKLLQTAEDNARRASELLKV